MQGLIDSVGNIVLPFVYDSLSSPVCGLISCCREPDGKYGFIDLSGSVAIPFRYDLAANFEALSGLAFVEERGATRKYSLIDRTGRAINMTPYDSIAHPREGRIRYTEAGLEGYLDEGGSVIIPPQFAGATEFASGLAAVRYPAQPGGKYYYIDETGSVRLGPYDGQVAYWCEFRDGLARVQPSLHSPTKYITPAGNVAFDLDPLLTGSPFSYGFAMVWHRDKNLCGYIDTRGQYFIPPSFDKAESFVGGFALVTVGNEQFFIDTKGDRVPCPRGYLVAKTYPSCSRMNVVDSSRRWGVADLGGNLIIEAVYKSIYRFSENHAAAEL